MPILGYHRRYMGQTVVIRDVIEIGHTLLLDTDRSFTGQDGQSMTPTTPGDAVPGQLAGELFALDPGIDHIYVLQNTVSIQRSEGWDESLISKVTEATTAFLRFYQDDPVPV